MEKINLKLSDFGILITICGIIIYSLGLDYWISYYKELDI